MHSEYSKSNHVPLEMVAAVALNHWSLKFQIDIQHIYSVASCAGGTVSMPGIEEF